MGYVLEYENGLEYAEHLDGRSWYQVAKSRSKLRKRLPHHHTAQTRAITASGLYIERCWCGAYGPRPWFSRF